MRLTRALLLPRRGCQSAAWCYLSGMKGTGEREPTRSPWCPLVNLALSAERLRTRSLADALRHFLGLSFKCQFLSTCAHALAVIRFRLQLVASGRQCSLCRCNLSRAHLGVWQRRVSEHEQSALCVVTCATGQFPDRLPGAGVIARHFGKLTLQPCNLLFHFRDHDGRGFRRECFIVHAGGLLAIGDPLNSAPHVKLRVVDRAGVRRINRSRVQHVRAVVVFVAHCWVPSVSVLVSCAASSAGLACFACSFRSFAKNFSAYASRARHSANTAAFTSCSVVIGSLVIAESSACDVSASARSACR